MNYELFFVCTQYYFIIIKYVKLMSALFYSEQGSSPIYVCVISLLLFRFIIATYFKYFFVISIGMSIEKHMLFECNM